MRIGFGRKFVPEDFEDLYEQTEQDYFNNIMNIMRATWFALYKVQISDESEPIVTLYD